MFAHHHISAEVSAHRDRLLADAERFRLIRLARAARRRGRDGGHPPEPVSPRAATQPRPPVGPARNTEADGRCAVQA